MKKRLLFFEITKHFEHKNVLVITGMRQVGKTTLLKQVFEFAEERPKAWFDLDNPLDQKLFEDVEYRNIYDSISLLENPRLLPHLHGTYAQHSPGRKGRKERRTRTT